jgi:hypothetical protein
MRNIIILVLIIVALAIVRSLISDVSRAVSKAMSGDKKKAEEAKPAAEKKTGRFVRDPHTGAYIDEESAVRATVDGESFYFESAKSRDAFLKSRPKA